MIKWLASNTVADRYLLRNEVPYGRNSTNGRHQRLGDRAKYEPCCRLQIGSYGSRPGLDAKLSTALPPQSEPRNSDYKL